MAKKNTNIQHLLTHISAINMKYEQIAEITGENFNVFKILGLTTNEVRTHSAFIAELLDPKGSHGCKDAFLKLFVEKLRSIINDQTNESKEKGNQILDRINKFIGSDKCKANVEYHIGEINEEKTVGGRIDILLRDHNNHDNHEIIIENKIYAYEQENQLIRYYNYNKNAPIIFLTLYGGKPNSANGLKEFEHFLCISYKEDVKNWLEQCLKETINKPLLRETITQYINLIKHLTNQTMNDIMKNEMIKEIIKSSENILAAIEIANNIDNIKNVIFSNFFKSLNTEGVKINLKVHSYDGESIRFVIPNLNEYLIVIERRENSDILDFGIFRLDGFSSENEGAILRNKVENLIGGSICRPGSFYNWLWLKNIDFEFEDLISTSFIDETLNDVIKMLQKLESLNQE